MAKMGVDPGLGWTLGPTPHQLQRLEEDASPLCTVPSSTRRAARTLTYRRVAGTLTYQTAGWHYRGQVKTPSHRASEAHASVQSLSEQGAPALSEAGTRLHRRDAPRVRGHTEGPEGLWWWLQFENLPWDTEMCPQWPPEPIPPQRRRHSGRCPKSCHNRQPTLRLCSQTALIPGPRSTPLPPGQEESQLLKLVLTGALRQNPPPRPEEAPSPELHLPPPTKTNLRRIKGPDVEHSIIKTLRRKQREEKAS